MREVPVAVVSRPWISLKSRFSPAALRFARFRRRSTAVLTLADARPPAWAFLFGRFNFQSSTALRARQAAGRPVRSASPESASHRTVTAQGERLKRLRP
jgi:nicotinate-nucleotide adenylyltransferase